MSTPRPNAYDPPQWEPTRRADDEAPLSLSEAVGQSLGAASACWENLAGAGVFESTRCGEIYEWLMAYLSDWADEIRKQANEATAAKLAVAEPNVEDLVGRIVRAGFDVTITPRQPAADHQARLTPGETT